jgi:adenylate kinase
MDYNLIAHRPIREGVCDICQGKLVARADDNPVALANRLRDYHEETKPLIAIFERKEFVATIDATRSVEEVQVSIRERFGLPPMSSS